MAAGLTESILVSVREHIESTESFMIYMGWPDSRVSGFPISPSCRRARRGRLLAYLAGRFRTYDRHYMRHEGRVWAGGDTHRSGPPPPLDGAREGADRLRGTEFRGSCCRNCAAA